MYRFWRSWMDPARKDHLNPIFPFFLYRRLVSVQFAELVRTRKSEFVVPSGVLLLLLYSVPSANPHVPSARADNSYMSHKRLSFKTSTLLPN